MEFFEKAHLDRQDTTVGQDGGDGGLDRRAGGVRGQGAETFQRGLKTGRVTAEPQRMGREAPPLVDGELRKRGEVCRDLVEFGGNDLAVRGCGEKRDLDQGARRDESRPGLGGGARCALEQNDGAVPVQGSLGVAAIGLKGEPETIQQARDMTLQGDGKLVVTVFNLKKGENLARARAGHRRVAEQLVHGCPNSADSFAETKIDCIRGQAEGALKGVPRVRSFQQEAAQGVEFRLPTQQQITQTGDRLRQGGDIRQAADGQIDLELAARRAVLGAQRTLRGPDLDPIGVELGESVPPELGQFGKTAPARRSEIGVGHAKDPEEAIIRLERLSRRQLPAQIPANGQWHLPVAGPEVGGEFWRLRRRAANQSCRGQQPLRIAGE